MYTRYNRPLFCVSTVQFSSTSKLQLHEGIGSEQDCGGDSHRDTCALTLIHQKVSWFILPLFSHWVVSDSLPPLGLQHTRLSVTLSITISQSLLRLICIESVMPSNRLVFCRPLLLLPPIFPGIGVFSTESVLLIRWPTYWNFSFSISPSNEYSGLIFFED